MFSHVVIGSNDIDRAQAFYDSLLAVLGAAPGQRLTGPGGVARIMYFHGGAMLGITEPINGEAASVGNGSTLGFRCESAEQVRRFHDTAVALGGTAIEDPPGFRSSPAGAAYLAYVRDPDGHKLCAVYREPPKG